MSQASAVNHREQLPGALHTFQSMSPVVIQSNVGSHHEVAHGREEGSRQDRGQHPGGDVDRDPADVGLA
jgi:hypothetical protein